jgi:hypothetical protein
MATKFTGVYVNDGLAATAARRYVTQAAAILSQAKAPPVTFFGAKCDGVSDDDDAWSDVAEALNAGDYAAVRHDGGTSVVNGPIPALLGKQTGATYDNFGIVGGPGAVITVASGASRGALFTLGDAATGNYARGLVLRDLRIERMDAASILGTDFLIDAQRVNGFHISGLSGSDWPAFMRAQLLSNGVVERISAEFAAKTCELSPNHLLIEKATSVVFRAINLIGNYPSNATVGGALVALRPQAGNNIDTLFFDDWNTYSFSVADGTPDGKEYAFLVDTTDSDVSVSNVWIRGGAFDHSTVAGFRFKTPSGSDTNTRNFNITGARFQTDAGKAVDINRDGPGLTAGMQITGNQFYVKTNSHAADIRGTNFRGCVFENNRLLDLNGATVSKPQAEKWNVTGGGWKTGGNSVGSADLQTPGWSGSRLIAADANKLFATPNHIQEDCTFGNGDVLTFSPTITCASPGTLSIAYTSQTGRVVRIGKMAYVNIDVAFTPTVGTGTGAVLIDGFGDTGLAMVSAATLRQGLSINRINRSATVSAEQFVCSTNGTTQFRISKIKNNSLEASLAITALMASIVTISLTGWVELA